MSTKSARKRRNRTHHNAPATKPRTPLALITTPTTTVSLLHRRVRPARLTLSREHTEARAALTAAHYNLPIPVRAWRALASGTATALLADDTHIVWTLNGYNGAPFLAYTVQPDHSLTEHPIHGPADLHHARQAAYDARNTAAVDHMHQVADFHAARQDAIRAVKAITPVRTLRAVLGPSDV